MLITASAPKAAWAGFSCALLVITWQSLTVRYNYQGQWSALFCTGSKTVIPPIVAAEHPYEFTGAAGWDGQIYHAIAHDPWLRRGSVPYVEAARLRYRRILIPALAYVLAGGNDRLVDPMYRFVIVLFVGLGAGWLALLMQAKGKPAVLGLIFLILPASVASIDREAIDVGLLSLCCAFVVYTRHFESPKILYIVLLLAGLVRDTGLLLVAAYCIWLLLQRDVRKSAAYATAAVPAIGWYLFVNSRTPPYSEYGSLAVPFSGVIHRLMHPMEYFGGTLSVLFTRSMDVLAAAGVLMALIWAIRFAWRARTDPVHIAVILFALLGILIWQPGNWLEALDYARILSPLLFFEALEYLERPHLAMLAPFCMALPRFGIEMGPQMLGVLKGLLTA